jgi:hypothetical protein
VVLKQQTIIHTVFYGNVNADRHIRQDFVAWKQITSAVKREAFVKVRMSCILPRSCWCNITVLNMHAPTEDTYFYIHPSTFIKFITISKRSLLYWHKNVQQSPTKYQKLE